jgi:hypothetical protein
MKHISARYTKVNKNFANEIQKKWLEKYKYKI